MEYVQADITGLAKAFGFYAARYSCPAGFFLSYLIRQGSLIPYQHDLYRTMGILLTVFNFLVIVILDSMHNVVKRGYYQEFLQTIKQCSAILAMMVLCLFSMKSTENYSRTIIYLTYGFHIALGYGSRVLWKKKLQYYMGQGRAESFPCWRF